MFEEINKRRQAVERNIAKGFGIDDADLNFEKALEDELEKGRAKKQFNIGDTFTRHGVTYKCTGISANTGRPTWSKVKDGEGSKQEQSEKKEEKKEKYEEQFQKESLAYLNEDVKCGTIKYNYGEEAEKIAKKVLTKRKKERKEFLDSTPDTFTDEQCGIYLSKYRLQSEPSAIVNNTWHTLMGRIGSTSASIVIGKGKEKSFSDNIPDWRPIARYSYSFMQWNGKMDTVSGFVQSWDEVKKCLSDTENMSISIYKHPKQ